MTGFGNAVAIVAFLIFTALIFALLGFVISLCSRDARRRGKSPLLVSIACILFFPWGLVAWLIFRPNPVQRRPRAAFRLRDYRIQ
jgi:hypothetical protein